MGGLNFNFSKSHASGLHPVELKYRSGYVEQLLANN